MTTEHIADWLINSDFTWSNIVNKKYSILLADYIIDHVFDGYQPITLDDIKQACEIASNDPFIIDFERRVKC